MGNIFIDASGVSGTYRNDTRFPFYVVSAVFVVDDKNTELIEAVRKELLPFLPHNEGEFKSSKPCTQNDQYVAKTMELADWCFCSALGNRMDFEGSGFEFPKPCQKWFTRRALSMVPTALREGRVSIDAGGAVTEKDLLQYIKKRMNRSEWKALDSICIVDSKESPGVQLADLLAGIIRKISSTELMNKKTRLILERQYEMIATRELNQWTMKPQDVRTVH